MLKQASTRLKTVLSAISILTLLAPATAYCTKEAREVASMAELKTHLASKQPVVIMFYAPWCGACSAMKEPFNRVSDLLKKDALLIRINAENEKLKEALDQFGIEAVPTLVIKHVGMMDQDQLSSALRCLLKKPSLTPKVTPAPQKAAPVQKAAPTPKKAPQAASKKTAIPARKAGSLAVAQGSGNRPTSKKSGAIFQKKAPTRNNSHKA